jgi:hypothetical protein
MRSYRKAQTKKNSQKKITKEKSTKMCHDFWNGDLNTPPRIIIMFYATIFTFDVQMQWQVQKHSCPKKRFHV